MEQGTDTTLRKAVDAVLPGLKDELNHPVYLNMSIQRVILAIRLPETEQTIHACHPRVQEIVGEFAAEPEGLSAMRYDMGSEPVRRRRLAKLTEGEGIIPGGYERSDPTRYMIASGPPTRVLVGTRR